MKKLLLFVFVFINVFAKSQEKEQSISITKERPADYEYLSLPDSTGKRTLLQSAVNLNAAKTQSTNIKLPYPIIFIHGLNSSAETWTTTTYSFMTPQYGLTNGGRFDYCLGFDGNDATSNTNFYPTAGADIAVFSGTWISGDYYYVNFDIGDDGSYSPTSLSANQVWSNQSAIVKQGKALRDAIYRVLQLTGRDKVVLIGHSMGGLAAREYLQNPSNWQPDGQSHVAKLVTTGTPHGGSNSTSFGFVSSNTNGQSEAIRDLRRTYYYSNNSGVYLFGGQENLPYMNDQSCCYFYNSDVNCNGTAQTNIVGLNQKSIYTNLDYSNIIGECSGCVGTTNPGDGVVWDICANLNNYYTNITTNLFYYYASAAVQIHTDLPSQYDLNMQGLDEPEYYSLAYHVGTDTTYTGFLTVPAATDPNAPFDVDAYKFSVTSNGNTNVIVNNIIVALGYTVNIVNSSNQIVGTAIHTSGSPVGINFTTALNTGNYYLQIYAIPTASSYLTPYNFILHNTSTTGIETSKKIDDITIYPNPTKGQFIIETNTMTKQTIDLFDINGKHVFSKSISDKEIIDVTTLNEGIYTLTIKTADGVINKKLVIVR